MKKVDFSNVTKEQINKRLLEEIKRSGYNLAEVGRKVGLTRAAVSTYKAEGKLPTILNLARIIKAIGADANYIFGNFEE